MTDRPSHPAARPAPEPRRSRIGLRVRAACRGGDSSTDAPHAGHPLVVLHTTRPTDLLSRNRAPVENLLVSLSDDVLPRSVGYYNFSLLGAAVVVASVVV